MSKSEALAAVRSLNIAQDRAHSSKYEAFTKRIRAAAKAAKDAGAKDWEIHEAANYDAP